MKEYQKSIIPLIEANYDNFTGVEHTIADFFIKNKKVTDFSIRNISKLLFISEASLSRFAKKLGCKGYREFIYNYENDHCREAAELDANTETVLNTYQELLNKSYNLLDEKQLIIVANLLAEKRRIFVYGKGCSGLAAQEFQIRFMRVGLDVEVLTDSHLLAMNAVRLNKDCLVIAISVSGTTKEVIEALDQAKERGGTTVLITSRNSSDLKERFDEVILASVKKNLEYGNVISPQFPVLIVLDAIYTKYLCSDRKSREANYDFTLNAILSRNM